LGLAFSFRLSAFGLSPIASRSALSPRMLLPMNLLSSRADLTGWLEARFSQHTRTFEDEYGSFYAYFEGAMGGETVLIWAPKTHLAEVFAALPKSFKGRLVLGLDASPGYAVPFARALYWAAPRYAVLVGEGQGIVGGFPGAKGLERGAWVAWEDPREAARLEVSVRSDYSYAETLAYAPWTAPALSQAQGDNRPPDPAESRFRVGSVSCEAGIPTYGAGLVGLEHSLQVLLEGWKLSVPER